MGINKDTVKRIKLGDQEVFKELYNLYYENLCKFIYSRFLQNTDETEEVVQGMFVKLWENHDKLPEIYSIKSYLYKAASNMAINFLAHKKVQLKHKNEAFIKLKSIEPVEDVSENEKEATINELKGLIDEMPEQTKEVFKLKYINGNKYKEIAKKMNISPKTVETLIYRGLKQLREKINKNIVSEKRNKPV